MKIALLAAILAGHAMAADPSSGLPVAGTATLAAGAIPAFVATPATARQAAPAPVGREGSRARFDAIKAAFGAGTDTTLCDKARAFCDQGSAYWCNYEDQHCGGGF